jgi:Fe2+ transport system protein B
MLSQGLNGAPVIRTVASKGKGIDELLQAAIKAAGAQ